MIHSQFNLLGERFGKLGEVNLPVDASNIRPQAANDAQQLLTLVDFNLKVAQSLYFRIVWPAEKSYLLR